MVIPAATTTIASVRVYKYNIAPPIYTKAGTGISPAPALYLLLTFSLHPFPEWFWLSELYSLDNLSSCQSELML